MKSIYNIAIACFLIINITACSKPSNTVSSPDGKTKLSFNLTNGIPTYKVIYNNDTIINTSHLGFEFKEQDALKDQFEIIGSSISSADETWLQPWGKNKSIRDHYNQLKIELKEIGEPGRLMNIFFRTYNDGAAFRYEFPEQENLKTFIISNELTEFNITDNPTTWWIEANYDTYEKLYKATPMNEAEWVATPVTMIAKNNVHISIHEAALTNYSGMTLKQNKKGVYEAELVPWANGDKVRTKAPMLTPWRTIQIEDSAAELVESSLILNLNEPCKNRRYFVDNSYEIYWNLVGNAYWYRNVVCRSAPWRKNTNGY